MTLLQEVREIERKLELPVKRTGKRGLVVPTNFTKREKNLLMEMVLRYNERHPLGGGHIANPMSLHKERIERKEGHNSKGEFNTG